MQCGSHHYHTRWVCDSPLFAPLELWWPRLGFSQDRQMRSRKKQDSLNWDVAMAVHPTLANMHIPSQCHQVVSVFGFSLGFSRLFMFFLSSLASGFRSLIFAFHSISFVFSLLWIHFRTVSSFLPISCAISAPGMLFVAISWFDSSGSLPTGPLGLFLCPLPLTSYVGAGVRMHIC